MAKSMRYIQQKLWDILGKKYETYYGIYWFKIVGYICKTMEFIQKDHGIIFSKTMGYRRLRL